MALSIGIVGLPNVGKSTTFNALTKAQNAEAANYPSARSTQQGHRAVPDRRIDKARRDRQAATRPVRHHRIRRYCGPGEGREQGRAWATSFWRTPRNRAIVHVVRCFEDENVVHVHAKPDPKDDIEVIQTELLLADLQQLEKKIEKLKKQAKTDRKLQPQLDIAEALAKHLESGAPASNFADRESDAYIALEQEMKFITAKTVIYAANVDEAGLGADNEYVTAVRELAARENAGW